MLVSLGSMDEWSKTILLNTYRLVIIVLSVDEAAKDAVLLSRYMVMEHSFMLDIEVYAALASLVAKDSKKREIVVHAMNLAKATGYVLDNA